MIDGNGGSAILDQYNKVIGFFHYMSNKSTNCFTVLASELQKGKYKIYVGMQT